MCLQKRASYKAATAALIFALIGPLSLLADEALDVICPKVDPVKEKQIVKQIEEMREKGRVREQYKQLVQWLRSDPSQAVQIRSALALWDFVSPLVRDELLAMAMDKKVIWFRATAVGEGLEGQAEILTDEHVLKLLDTKDSNQLTGAIALAAVVEINPTTREAVLAYIKSPNQAYRTSVAGFIDVELGLDFRKKRRKELSEKIRTRHKEILLEVAKNDPEESLRRYAAMTLVEAQFEEGLPYLLAILKSDFEELKKGKKERPLGNLCNIVWVVNKSTGQHFGADSFKTPEDQEKAVVACLEWWKTEKDKAEEKK